MHDVQKALQQLDGYTNLRKHFKRAHPSYEDVAQKLIRGRNAFKVHVADSRITDIYRWCEWVVVERHMFIFVEQKLTRSN